MSLFTLPVSVSDLTQLQLGIEFFTNSTEATAEAGLITNPPSTSTVYSYAVQLLANNISLSQVAMAVDSLMFGVTDNVAELTKLATQFLPAQVANAVAHGLNPTVYAAEALGLALAGGNGSSNAFATNVASLSVSDFASAVASLTGINSGAIEGFVSNWIKFYTANPPAGGLPVTLASYGAAFGDAVGAALLNPTVNGTLALLVSEVQNALIDNAEGSYKTAIALLAEPPHRPLQGEAFLIPSAGGTLDWAALPGAPAPYAELIAPAQVADLNIKNAPGTFTLNTQHYGTNSVEIDVAGGGNGNLFTLILGDSAFSESLGSVITRGYPTVEIVVAEGSGGALISGAIGPCRDLVISGSGPLSIGAVEAVTITDTGVALTIGATDADKIDASNAPFLHMKSPSIQIGPTVGGVTVLGGIGAGVGNILQGSVGPNQSTVTFSDGSTGVSLGAGADNITGGTDGNDLILGDGGADTITLPTHSVSDALEFGKDLRNDVLAITDGMDVAYPGSWGASVTATAIPNLFPGNTGGTSADMTVITGFRAGSGGDGLGFNLKAWNGDITPFLFHAAAKGNLVELDGVFVPTPGGDAQLSAVVWMNSSSNSSLKPSDNVLLYAPSDASVQNAQQLAAQLHTSSDAIVLPGAASGLGFIAPGQHSHIFVAYDASFSLLGSIHHVVNIADVDLVNTSASNQTSTANLHVYASDMVSLTGVSLTSLAPDNIFYLS
jgi:hypothetical protein